MVLNAPMMKFYNGNEVPSFGLGTWKVSIITDDIYAHIEWNNMEFTLLNLFAYKKRHR